MAHTALRGVRGLEITRALLNSIWLNQHLFDAHRKEREREEIKPSSSSDLTDRATMTALIMPSASSSAKWRAGRHQVSASRQYIV